jgi:hypothetical protein
MNSIVKKGVIMNWFQGLRARILVIALHPLAGFLIMMGIFNHVERQTVLFHGCSDRMEDSYHQKYW